MHAWQSSNFEAMGTCRVFKKALACLPVGDMTYVYSSCGTQHVLSGRKSLYLRFKAQMEGSVVRRLSVGMDNADNRAGRHQSSVSVISPSCTPV